MKAVFMYGAGRDGRAAWPAQRDRPGFTFLERVPGAIGDEPAKDADHLLEALGADGGHLVAASYGAIAALLAAARAPELVRSVTLFEPACLGIARGSVAVEEHVRAMAPVFATAADETVGDATFASAFYAALGVPIPPDDDDLRSFGKRLRATPPPWEPPASSTQVIAPTLVVTGGWNEMYEEVAIALTRLGAEHRRFAGSGHRPQDHPDATGVLCAFCERVDAR